MIRQVDIQTADGVCDAHLALTSNGTGPGVLYCMDAFGLRPVVDHWIERIASAGYVVLAPNLLYRGGRSPIVDMPPKAMDQDQRAKLFERIRPLMQQLTFENAQRDGKAYLDYLRTVAAEPFGVTGYCMGAAFAVRVAAAFPDRIAAVGCFHGGNLASEDPASPHLLAGQIKAEVYAGHADQDQSMPPEQQERLRAAMADAGVRFTGEVYADAPHGYTQQDTAAYREQAAERHFIRLVDLLDRNLKR